jgi:hypothetical protein
MCAAWLVGLVFLLLPGVGLSSQCTIVRAKGFTFQVTTNEGKRLQAKTRFLLKEQNGTMYWNYRHIRGDVCWNVTTDRMARPILVSYSDGQDFMHVRFEGNGTVRMQGGWDGRPIEKEARFEEGLTAECCMPARMLCREQMDSYTFQLLRSEKFPELKTYQMRLSIVGSEVVQVPAGSFDCHKVRLVPVNPLLQPFYEGYLFITRQPPHYIVRMENVPKGFEYALKSIHSLPLAGGRTACVPNASGNLGESSDCDSFY